MKKAKKFIYPFVFSAAFLSLYFAFVFRGEKIPSCLGDQKNIHLYLLVAGLSGTSLPW